MPAAAGKDSCCNAIPLRPSQASRGFQALTSATRVSITGTSTSTPTTVANAAPEFSPNREIATATASSKKFEVPIRQAGPAMSCGSFSRRAAHHDMKKIP